MPEVISEGLQMRARTEKLDQNGVERTLDGLAREGARAMIAAALELEVDEYLVS